MSKKAVGWVLLFITVICILWLVFCSIMLFKTLFPPDRYLITASEGAALRVENGGVTSLPGSSGRIDMTSYNPLMKTLIAGSAVPVFLMAIYGCFCLINESKSVGDS